MYLKNEQIFVHFTQPQKIEDINIKIIHNNHIKYYNMNKITYHIDDQHTGNSVTKETEILNALKNNSVHSLLISYVKIDIFILQFLDHLQLNNSLCELTLRNTKIGTHVIELCKILNKNCNINKLDIIENDIDNDGIYALAELLSKNTKITSLSIGESNLSTLNITSIFDSLCDNTRLDELHIDCDTLYYDNIKSLVTMLHSNMTLRHLNLSMEMFNIDDLHIFADALRANISLEKLTMCNIDPELNESHLINYGSMEIIIDALTYNSNLRYLEICCGIIEDTEALMIANLLKTNHSLEYLILLGTNIGISGAINLCNQSSLKYLEVHVDCDLISDDNIDELSKSLRTNTTLTELGIQYMGINDQFWSVLVDKIQENYTIINFIGLHPAEMSDTVSDFLARNRKIADEPRFKKVKALESI